MHGRAFGVRGACPHDGGDARGRRRRANFVPLGLRSLSVPASVPASDNAAHGAARPITCEIHPKIGGYFTHVERTFCLGEPDKETQRIHDGCVAAFRRGMELFGPGKSIVECMNEVKRVIDDAGLGIARPEFTATDSPRLNTRVTASTL